MGITFLSDRAGTGTEMFCLARRLSYGAPGVPVVGLSVASSDDHVALTTSNGRLLLCDLASAVAQAAVGEEEQEAAGRLGADPGSDTVGKSGRTAMGADGGRLQMGSVDGGLAGVGNATLESVLDADDMVSFLGIALLPQDKA
jgi:hypothetical protein